MKAIRCLIFSLLFSLAFNSIYSDPPKAVIFDFGKVIAHLNRKPMLHFISDSFEIPLEQVSKDFSGETLYKALKKPRSFWEKYAQKKLPDEWFVLLKERETDMIQFTPGMLQLVEKLKQQGIQVAILSNTSPFRANFIQSKGGYESFDPIILSCDVGVGKPSARIFNILFKKLRLNPESCVFVDNKKLNIAGGEKVGMQGIRFKSIEQLKEELIKRGIAL